MESIVDLSTGNHPRGRVDITMKPNYQRYSPYKCVLSNSSTDFVCHTIYIISSSDYFYNLLKHSQETIDVEHNGPLPRIKVMFSDQLINSFLEYAYHGAMDVGSSDALCQLLEFASYINSVEILKYLEREMCDKCDKLTFDQMRTYGQLAKEYMLDDLGEKVNDRIKMMVGNDCASEAARAASTDDPIDPAED